MSQKQNKRDTEIVEKFFKNTKKSIHKRVFWSGKRYADIYDYLQWTIGAKSSGSEFGSIESNLLNFLLGVQIGNHQQAFDVVGDIEVNSKITRKEDKIQFNQKTLDYKETQGTQCQKLALTLYENVVSLVTQNDQKALLLLNVSRLHALAVQFGIDEKTEQALAKAKADAELQNKEESAKNLSPWPNENEADDPTPKPNDGDEDENDEPVYSKPSAITTFEESIEAASELSACHPIRLKITQHFSLFQYKVMKEPEKAIQTLTEAIDNAESQIDFADEKTQRKARNTIDHLKNQLSSWTKDFAPQTPQVKELNDDL